MRRVGVRLPDRLWADVREYADHAGLRDEHGTVDISEVLRDLIMRGLSPDRSSDRGYRAGYREGRLAGYRDLVAQLGGHR